MMVKVSSTIRDIAKWPLKRSGLLKGWSFNTGLLETALSTNLSRQWSLLGVNKIVKANFCEH